MAFHDNNLTDLSLTRSKRGITIFITVPDMSLQGGVVGYFKVVAKYFTVRNRFFQFETSDAPKPLFFKIIPTLEAYRNLSKNLGKNWKDVDIVHINPSLNYGAVLRDALFLFAAKNNGIRAIVFFHGWNQGFERFVDRYFRGLFYHAYNKTDAFIVLSSRFRNRLRAWGFKQPIFVESTPVDDELLQGYSQEQRLNTLSTKHTLRLLFLARVEREKGILEALKTTKILVEQQRDIRLIVAGDGSYLEKARKYAREINIESKVDFLGFVKGRDKIVAFSKSDIYLFPTYHGEGMPASVLEAMAFGLPVITRPVGGLNDFFRHGEHGFMTESKNPQVFANLTVKMAENETLWKKISLANYEFAKRYFLASNVAKRLEEIYSRIIFLPVDYNQEHVKDIGSTVWWER